jgi:RHS repeat-associated protein
MLTDAAGTATATFTYRPYGRLAASTGTQTTPLGFAGQYTDPESGLPYLRARYYDPATAQFLSRDPIALITRSAYAYVEGDPVNFVDPSGLYSVGDFWDDVTGTAKEIPNTISSGEAADYFGNGVVDAGEFGFGDDPVEWGLNALPVLGVAGKLVKGARLAAKCRLCLSIFGGEVAPQRARGQGKTRSSTG